MGSYTVLQWATFFMLYCIFGWCYECTYCSVKSGHLQNRGFCHGPWIPIYGVGSCLLVLLTHGHEGNLFYLFCVGFIGGTCLEFVTGVTMNKLFHMRWWDYSQNPLNFHGYICVPASIGWGCAAIFLMRVLHPRISAIPADWSYITFVIINTMFYTLFVEDVIFSTIGALELKERVARLAANSEEIQNLRKSIAEAYERLADARAELELSAEEFRTVQKTEGNVAAAKFMASTVKDSTVAVAGSVKESTLAVAESVKDSTLAVAGTVKDSTLAVADSVKSSVSAMASSVGGALSFPSTRKLRDLEANRERLEERLALLEDGGNEHSGKMPWWIKTMLRNNPEAVSEDAGFNDLKTAALKPLHEKKQNKSSLGGKA